MAIYTAEEIANIIVPQDLPTAAAKGVLNTICRSAPILAGYGLLTGSLPAIAFGTGGSIACGLPIFPGPTRPPVFLPFPGGQCPGALYRVTADSRLLDGSGAGPTLQYGLGGPVRSWGFVKGTDGFGQPRWFFNYVDVDYPQGRSINVNLNHTVWEILNVRFSLVSGPDNCGDPPPSIPPLPPGVQLPPGYPDAPRIPGGNPRIPYRPPKTPPESPPFIIPIIIPPILLRPVIAPNFNISAPINIPVSIPVSINPAINGTINVQIGPSGEIRTPPDLICDCEVGDPPALPPSAPTSEYDVVYYECGSVKDLRTATLTVVTSSIPDGLTTKLVESALLAEQRCQDENPVQVNPAQLFSGRSGDTLVAPQYTGVLPAEVVSVEIRLSNYSLADYRELTTFPGGGQRKFGAISYCLQGLEGGSDQVYLWDDKTFFRLPQRIKPGRLKLILRPGISWQVWDTGERV